MIEYLISGAVGAVMGAVLRPMIFPSPTSSTANESATVMNTVMERAKLMDSKVALLVGVAHKPDAPQSIKKDLVFTAVDLDTGSLIEPDHENHLSPAGTRIDTSSGKPVLVNKDGTPVPDEYISCHEVMHFWQFGTGTCQCFWSPGKHVHKCW